MKQCPKCGHINDEDANFCVNCGHKFSTKRHYVKIVLPALLALVVISALAFAIPNIFSPSPQQIIILKASDAESIFGGSWQVLQNETYLKLYPTENVTIYYANGTTVEIPVSHHVKSIDHEVLIGNVNGTKVVMIVQMINFTSSNPLELHHMIKLQKGDKFGFSATKYDNYTIIYFASTFPYPHTVLLAFRNNTVIEVVLKGYVASLNQMEEVLKDIQ